MKKRKVRQIVMEFMTELESQKRVRQPKPRRAVATKLPPLSATVEVKKPAHERKPLRFSPELILASRRPADRKPRVNPFRLPDFPIQLTDHIPADRRMAMDEGINGAAAWAGGAWNNFGYSAAFEGVTFLGYPYLAELAQRPEYRVIVETIATEMTRKWIKLQAKGDQDKSEQIDELGEELERLKVRDMFCRVCEVDGYFGRAHLYIDTGDTDNPKELLTPIGNGENTISGKKIGKGDVKRLVVVEPTWTYPASYNTNNPLKPDWYNPQRWFVMASEVHASRLLRFVGREVPDLLKPTYSFGGLAMTQMAKPYVDNWLNVRQSTADIIQAFSVFVLGTNLAETLTPSGDQLFERADAFNNLRDNRGLMMIDKDTETFQNVSAPLGTLDALQAQAQEHMAAVSRIPLVKLLGISPHGLNATAEPELRAFYDSILAKQEQFFSPNLRRIIAFAQINIWGKVDPDITFTYEPLWSLDEKGAAEVRKLDAETGQIHVDIGVIDVVEERARVANDPDTLYPGLDIEDLPDLKEEEEEGLEPKGSAERLAAGETDEDAPDAHLREGGAQDSTNFLASDADFVESEHPRDDDGKFGSGAASQKSSQSQMKLRTKYWGGENGRSYSHTAVQFRERAYSREAPGWKFGIDDDGTPWISGSSMPNEKNLNRAIQDYLSPLPEGIYIRTAWNKDDFNHLKGGTHLGSMNHATGNREAGLSVAKHPEFPQKFAYFVKGKQIGTGSDAEPILDTETAKPVGEIMSYKAMQSKFDKMRQKRVQELGLSPQQLKALDTGKVILSPKKYDEYMGQQGIETI